MISNVSRCGKTVVPVVKNKSVQIFWEQFGLFIKIKGIHILRPSNSSFLCPLWRDKCMPKALGRCLWQQCWLEHEIMCRVNGCVVWAEGEGTLFSYCWGLFWCIQELILKIELLRERSRWENEFMYVKELLCMCTHVIHMHAGKKDRKENH